MNVYKHVYILFVHIDGIMCMCVKPSIFFVAFRRCGIVEGRRARERGNRPARNSSDAQGAQCRARKATYTFITLHLLQCTIIERCTLRLTNITQTQAAPLSWHTPNTQTHTQK